MSEILYIYIIRVVLVPFVMLLLRISSIGSCFVQFLWLFGGSFFCWKPRFQ
ncbi:hypothetical protein Lalb_Chr07g0187651 [Lupinus albus]|uniref:Uncharacterized protein n=1 Tax=Lupinus albus TaxID=3870 RepID=A0A6A4QAK2_LUPAL|nr:hypothetical protein Lalb_Chr07g0187651 [Lupinus albus]